MKGPLFLTQYNSKQVVYVESKIVEKLTPYQVDGIRFLYQQCILNEQNVILNNDPGMQEERQICSFLTAIDRPAPSLIICKLHCLRKWYYEFSQVNLKVLTAEELIQNDSWETHDSPDAVLITHDQLKHIKTLPLEDWFFFIIQNLECLEKSRYIKNVNAQYRIGLVDQNYLNLTPELQLFAMKWANSDLVEDKEAFMKSDNLKKINFLWPFPDYWRRITWNTVQKFKPTIKQSEEYEQTVKKWCKENNPGLLLICEPDKRKSSRPVKRPTNKKEENKNNNRSKRRCVAAKLNLKREALSSDSEDDKNIVIVKPNNGIIQYSSDSDTQDVDINPVENEKQIPGNNFKIQNEVMSKNPNNAQTSKVECSSPSLLDDSKECFILNSLFDSPESATSKPVITTNIKSLENSEFKKVETKSDEEDNFILNSLIDSPEPSSSINQKSKELSDDENESCPILDLLF